MLLLPEIVLSGGILLLILVSCLSQFERYVDFSLSILLLTLISVNLVGGGISQHWLLDALSQVSQSLCILLSMWILWYGKDNFLKEKLLFITILLQLALLGVMVIVTAKSWLLLYVGLELIALPTYALCVINTDVSAASEAGLKYFVMGVVASILILYGISFIYLVSKSLVYQNLAVISDPAMQWYATLGIVLLLAGICFKFGLAPFHMWVPDVYQAAPINIVYWIATVPKIALVAMFIRLLKITSIGLIPATNQILLLIALLSISIGVMMAIKQVNIRRLVAYASIAHMGFVMLPLQVVSEDGFAGALIYMMGYIATTTVIFATLVAFKKKGIETIQALRGISQSMPHESFALLLSLAAMAGIPPLIGFITKLNIFYLLMQAGYVYTTILVVCLVAISAYYYMGVVRAMYFTSEVKMKVKTNYILLGMSLILIVMGIIPQTFLLQLLGIVTKV